MKLIDAYALTRTMYLKSFDTDDGRQRWDSGLWIRYKIFEEARDEQPTIDAVPVIRCKDCIYAIDEYGDNECYCRNRLNGTYLMYIKDWDHYCSWAERKES